VTTPGTDPEPLPTWGDGEQPPLALGEEQPPLTLGQG
jgi:hypothetical protein